MIFSLIIKQVNDDLSVYQILDLAKQSMEV